MLLWQTRPAHHARKRSTPGRVSGLGRLAPSALGLGRDLAGRVRRRDDQTLGDLPLRDNGLRVIAGHSGEASPRQLPRAQRCQDDELERTHIGGTPDHRTPVAALAKNVGKPVIEPSQSNALVRARAGKGLRAQESRCVEYTANTCEAGAGSPSSHGAEPAWLGYSEGCCRELPVQLRVPHNGLAGGTDARS